MLVGVDSVPPSHAKVPVTVTWPPVRVVPHRVAVIDRWTSATVGTASTCAVQWAASGSAIVTPSPSPGTPRGDQFLGSVQEWLSAVTSCELPTQEYEVPPATAGAAVASAPATNRPAAVA